MVSLVTTAGWLALRAGLDATAVSKLSRTGQQSQTAYRSRAALIVIEVSGNGGCGWAVQVGGRVRGTKMGIWRKQILRQGRKVQIEFTRKVTCS